VELRTIKCLWRLFGFFDREVHRLDDWATVRSRYAASTSAKAGAFFDDGPACAGVDSRQFARSLVILRQARNTLALARDGKRSSEKIKSVGEYARVLRRQTQC